VSHNCTYLKKKTPPEDDFKEAETYVGVFLNVLRKPYIGFLNKVHLVGDKTLISEKCTVILE
jgi:hypothetical protein